MLQTYEICTIVLTLFFVAPLGACLKQAPSGATEQVASCFTGIHFNISAKMLCFDGPIFWNGLATTNSMARSEMLENSLISYSK